MTIPKLAPYSMDAFRASLGNNEYTRLLFIKKFITILFLPILQLRKEGQSQRL